MIKQDAVTKINIFDSEKLSLGQKIWNIFYEVKCEGLKKKKVQMDYVYITLTQPAIVQ